MRIAGIRIEIDLSWLIILALVVFSLGAGYFPASFPNWGSGQIWLAAIITALLFFLSVLIHELSHSLVAKARGIDVESIRLFIFGGVSNIKQEARRPSEEFLISVVGPISSIILAGIFYLIGLVAAPNSAIRAVAGYLAVINIALGIFNLIPGFPLDGGRVLRSILWGTTKNFTTATRIAANVGKFVGYLFIFLGVWIAMAGGLIDGLWIGLIGWFIINAANQSYQQVVLNNMLQGVTVGQVMSRPRETVLPGISLAQLVHDYFIYRGERVLPIVENGYLVGIVAPENLRQVPPEQWNVTPVSHVMTRRQNVQVARPTDDLRSMIEKLSQQDQSQFMIPVLDENNQFVGIITPQEIMRFLQLRQQLGGVQNPAGNFNPTGYTQNPGSYNQPNNYPGMYNQPGNYPPANNYPGYPQPGTNQGGYYERPRPEEPENRDREDRGGQKGGTPLPQ
ncbi:MAG TPA: M50 family metallopeptidase [Chloroflexia bacterium]|nr:M50 family metallopeptidase [Chloroflexia bacterium]